MKFLSRLIPVFGLGLLQCSAASAQSITSYDYFKSPKWTLMQQYWGIYFDTCLAEATEARDGHRLSIGRTISGTDFIFVHGINDLIAPGESKVAGKVWINGKDGYDFSDVAVYDSAAFPGQKYVTIYLASGFIEQFAKANSVEIQFSQGRSKHSLQGSRDIINRLNDCMDAGLQREFEAPPPPPRTPLNWTAGTSQNKPNERFIYTKLPPLPGSSITQPILMGLAENGLGRFDIRLRFQEEQMTTRIDMASANAKRYAANILVNGTQAFATLVFHEGNNVDIIDIPSNDLAKLGVSGEAIVRALDGSVPDIKLNLTIDASFGPAAIAAAAPASTALTVDALVGTYYVRGKNPDGAIYYGTAVTSLENGNLRINWTWSNNKTDTAVANLLHNVVTAVVEGYAAPAIYTIGKDRVWRGTWDNNRASEVLVPKT